MFFGCNSSKNLQNENTVNLKVVGIKEYEYAYGLKTIGNDKDTLLVISFKDEFYNKYSLKKPDIQGSVQEIKINNLYDFKLSLIKPQVSNMEQLGAFIIIENDTLCKGRNYKEIPKTYSAQNTINLLLSE